MNIIKILRWPENKRKGIVPWFVALQRLVFIPIIFTLAILLVVFTFLAYGKSHAHSVFRRLF